MPSHVLGRPTWSSVVLGAAGVGACGSLGRPTWASVVALTADVGARGVLGCLTWASVVLRTAGVEAGFLDQNYWGALTSLYGIAHTHLAITRPNATAPPHSDLVARAAKRLAGLRAGGRTSHIVDLNTVERNYENRSTILRLEPVVFGHVTHDNNSSTFLASGL